MFLTSSPSKPASSMTPAKVLCRRERDSVLTRLHHLLHLKRDSVLYPPVTMLRICILYAILFFTFGLRPLWIGGLRTLYIGTSITTSIPTSIPTSFTTLIPSFFPSMLRSNPHLSFKHMDLCSLCVAPVLRKPLIAEFAFDILVHAYTKSALLQRCFGFCWENIHFIYHPLRHQREWL